MKKIGNLIPYLLFFFLANIPSFSWAQTSSIQVQAKLSETNIYNGESVLLEFIISGRSLNSIDRPTVLEVPGLRWISGSNRQGQSIQYVNGRPSVTYTYGYQFVANQVGNFTLPPFDITVNGETYRTEALPFRVLNPATSQQNGGNRPDIFVRLEPNKKTAFLGEQIIVDVVLYFKNTIEVRSYQASPGWKAEGFWKEELENTQQTRATSTLVEGERYQRAKLLQYALFASKRGSLVLSPFEVTVLIQQRNRRQDIFSFGLGQERKNIQTPPTEITINSLPTHQNTENNLFLSAVGTFQVERNIQPTEALVGESIEISTRISGTGNLPLIQPPAYTYPAEFEQYNPQEGSSLQRTGSTISGTKTFTDIVIARNEGNYTIPATQLSYFDPTAKGYQTIMLPAQTLRVSRDPNAVGSTTEMLRFDIKPVAGLMAWNQHSKTRLTQQPLILLFLLIPMSSLAIGFLVKKHQYRLQNDHNFARKRGALKTAKSNLEELRTKAENDSVGSQSNIKAYYHELYRILSNYITSRCGRHAAGWSTQDLLAVLENELEAVAPKILDRCKNILTKCDTISYAPTSSASDVLGDIHLSEQLIHELEKVLK
jgi:hypothetical protein